MKWDIKIQDQLSLSGIDWCKNFLSHYDTSQVEWIKIHDGSMSRGVLYGKCYYPTKKIRKYRLSCFAPGPFPGQVFIRTNPIYYDFTTQSWPATPKDHIENGIFSNGNVKWKRLLTWSPVNNKNEAIVWIFAHEAFHFLRRSRQIEGRNTEIEADRYADRLLDRYRLDVTA